MQSKEETLRYLTGVLRKPVSYFFPDPYGEFTRLENLRPLEQELLMQAHHLNDDDLRRLITQVRALAELE